MAVGDREVVLVDTAGLRKRARVQENVEFYSILRTERAIQHCDVAVLLVDGSQGLESQDARVLREAADAKKGLVVVVNKWDLVEKETNTARDWARAFRERLGMLDYVPIEFVSALTGQRAHRVLELALKVHDERAKRVPTAKLMEVVQAAIAAQHPPTYRGNYVQIKYATQVHSRPPVFAFFVNHPEGVKESYRRYLEGRIRDAFGFEGVPLMLSFRKK
jgi:GTP-binding protein